MLGSLVSHRQDHAVVMGCFKLAVVLVDDRLDVCNVSGAVEVAAIH